MKKHGHAHPPSPTYRSWQMMINRCTNPNADNYAKYGGRGIKVCERWRRNFEAFLFDMGERPEGTTLDRFPDTNGDYKLGNVRWATVTEQNLNRRPRRPLSDDERARLRALARPRRSVLVEGVARSLAEIAAMAGLSVRTIQRRLRQGESADDLVAASRSGP